MRTRQWVAVALVVGSALMLMQCGDDSPPPMPQPTGFDGGTPTPSGNQDGDMECAVNADCGQGQVCANGVCIQAPVVDAGFILECSMDAHCGPNEECEDGVCKPHGSGMDGGDDGGMDGGDNSGPGGGR